MNVRASRLLTRVLLGASAAAVGIVIAGPASAHVHVDGTDTTQGGYGVLTFRVPTESATASTTKISVAFPSATPVASVSTQPVAGWTAKVTTAKLSTPITTDDGSIDTYVASVTWTATSAATAIHPGEFQQFSVSAGPLPKADELVLPTTQTYSDGSVVRWNERSADAAAEPEHPAPVLTLAASTPASAPAATTASDDSPSWPGWTGLGAGCVALVLAALALARSRRVAPKP